MTDDVPVGDEHIGLVVGVTHFSNLNLNQSRRIALPDPKWFASMAVRGYDRGWS